MESRLLESIHRVRTPEYVEFDFPIAGLASRLLAWLIDVLIATAGAGVLTGAVWAGGFLVPGLAMALTFIIWFLSNWGYFAFFEHQMAGQTPGKRALGLRTIQESGVRVGFYHCAMRNLVRAIDHLPFFYVVGGALALLSRSGRRLGDLAAGTVVVRERRRRIPAGIARPAEAVAVLGIDRRVEERLRRASVEERELLIAAALRREELSMQARLGLFQRLGDYACDRFGLRKPEHLSAEKLVLAVVGVLVDESRPAPAKARLLAR